MFALTMRRARRKAERLSGLTRKYSFTREYAEWHTQHCLLVGLGILVDTMAEGQQRGRPCAAQLTMLIASASLLRLWLKLWEKNDPQPWNWPNLVTALRIVGLVGVSKYVEKSEESEEGGRFPPLSQGALAGLGLAFVALDFLDGYLARRLDQRTALGAHLDGQADALATTFIAVRLRCGATGAASAAALASPLPGLPDAARRFLSLHLAAAPYAWHLATVAPFTPKALRERCNGLRHPWARPAAGLMALLALLALALPALGPASRGAAAAVAAAASSSSSSHSSSSPFSFSFSFEDAGRLCGDAAGLVNVISFGLSYLVLYGPLLGITSLGVEPSPDDTGEAAAMKRLADDEKQRKEEMKRKKREKEEAEETAGQQEQKKEEEKKKEKWH
jgi:hypothetical protein